MIRSSRYVPSMLALLLMAGCAGTREPMQRADRAMAPGSVVGSESAQWDTPASLLSGKSPAYPIGQFMTGKGGYAEATFTVAQDGSTHNVKVVEADQPAFGNHLAVAIKGWRFEPARKDGQPIASQVSYGLCFEIVRNFSVPPSPHGRNRCLK